MQRSLFVPLAAAALATAALVGCGGGGGKHDTSPPTKGIVRIAYTGTPLVGATVNFYDSTGTSIGSAAVDPTGLITTVVPANALYFGINAGTTTVGGPYYSTFQYKGSYYDPSVNCYAPLPKQGSAVFKSDVVVFTNDKNNPPPPPPDGCIGASA